MANAQFIGNRPLLTGWLMKRKRDNAPSRLIKRSNWRYFTLDFESKVFYYAHGEHEKTVSLPVPFQSIRGVMATGVSYCEDEEESLVQAAATCQPGKRRVEQYGFIVRTLGKSFELASVSKAQAQTWMDAFREAMTVATTNFETGAKIGIEDTTHSADSSTRASTAQTVQTSSSSTSSASVLSRSAVSDASKKSEMLMSERSRPLAPFVEEPPATARLAQTIMQTSSSNAPSTSALSHQSLSDIPGRLATSGSKLNTFSLIRMLRRSFSRRSSQKNEIRSPPHTQIIEEEDPFMRSLGSFGRANCTSRSLDQQLRFETSAVTGDDPTQLARMATPPRTTPSSSRGFDSADITNQRIGHKSLEKNKGLLSPLQSTRECPRLPTRPPTPQKGIGGCSSDNEDYETAASTNARTLRIVSTASASISDGTTGSANLCKTSDKDPLEISAHLMSSSVSSSDDASKPLITAASPLVLATCSSINNEKTDATDYNNLLKMSEESNPAEQQVEVLDAQGSPIQQCLPRMGSSDCEGSDVTASVVVSSVGHEARRDREERAPCEKLEEMKDGCVSESSIMQQELVSAAAEEDVEWC